MRPITRTTSLAAIVATAFLATASLGPVASAEDGPAPAAPEKVKVRVSSKPGDKHLYLQSQSQIGSMMGMEMGHAMTNELTWTCASVAEDGATQWDVFFGPVRGSMTNPMLGGELEFDTSKQPAADAGADATDPGAMISKALGALTNKTVKLTLSPRGSVHSVTGLKAVLDGMLAEFGEGDPTAALMSAMMSEETITQSWSMNIPALPEGGAAVGESWQSGVSFSAGPGQTLELKTTNTLAKATADEVHITMKLVFDFKEFVADMAKKAAAEAGREIGPEEEAKMAEMMAQMTMDFSGTGTARFGRKDGLLAESTMDMLMKVELGEEAGGMAIEQTIKASLKRVDAFPAPKATKAAPAAPVPPIAPVAPPAEPAGGK